MKRKLSLLLALLLVLTMVPAVVSAEGFSDMPQDWSTEALTKAVENGLLTGYNGKLMPSESLTRAQMATIINRAFGAYVPGSLAGYVDVPVGKWYRDDMAKAVQMRTFRGDGLRMNPESPITREEAFIVMARAMKLEPSGVAPAGFTDLDLVSIWAKGEVYALINAGYIKGSNGMINPKGSITRAEFAQLMHNMIKNYVKTSGEYNIVGSGNVMVNVPGVTLKDLTVSGDLIVGEGVAEGDLILDNVDVTGRFVVRGGGVDSIIIKNDSTIGKVLVVTRYDGAVRVVFEDGTEADVIYVEDGNDKVIIEGVVGTLVINTDVPVELVGATVDEIQVNAPNAEVAVDKDSVVESVLVFKEAEGAAIVIDGKATSVVTAAPETTIEGDGKVEIVEVMGSASETVVDVDAEDIVVDEDAMDVTIPEEPKKDSGSTYRSPRLLTADLNGEDAVIEGDYIRVPFLFEENDTYVITANFNKAVRITSVEVEDWNLIQPSVSVPVGYSSTVTSTIDHDIGVEHFDEFGTTVTVTVTDGTTPIEFKIKLEL